MVSVPFVHVQARGSHRELGRAVGEAAREPVHASVDFFREHFTAMTGGRLTFAAAERQARAYEREARLWSPDLVEELEGLAEGSGVPFSRLLVLNCGEEFTAEEQPGSPASAPGSMRSGDHCTAVAVAVGGRHVVGHNMDWYTIDAVNNVLFDLTGPDGTRVMGLAGAPYLLMLGMNSHGIGNVSNSVHSTDNRIGVPNVFVRRSTLAARTLEEARERGLLTARARGTNQVFADTDGRLWDVETSATAHAFMDHTATGFMAHTNHYVAPEMRPFEGYAGGESEVRHATAGRLLAEGIAAGDDPVVLVARVLRSHEPAPDECICGHPAADDPPAEQVMTVGSMICDLDERRLYACAGPPCENEYRVFEMED
ncbi:MAG: Acyl-coenzyme A:6-aminopenicillanic acid acyl-transferase [Actinobacteria bacterium ADurb.BinA094]|nr:MAG: Acyl-coenzyme A:6-aminopenicillanic acid acyl-transferase [Actinobacteria bacterium ADurb.BinA094]